MRWINVYKARNLEIGVPMLLQDTAGRIMFGKLIEEKRTINGRECRFEITSFHDEIEGIDADGDVIQSVKTDIEFVMFPKPKTTNEKTKAKKS